MGRFFDPSVVVANDIRVTELSHRANLSQRLVQCVPTRPDENIRINTVGETYIFILLLLD